MPAIDTRHMEKNHLFSLYEVLRTGDVMTQIRRLEAIMEDEDIKQVRLQHENWQKDSPG